eukprot:CAMPEP_0194035598 /NCGR_PEP_ID=MMETSP0009_2-20130614/8006_1 /TAXON_ID=210454 /ORGANISM="Grammatophora oceanica, Strain CCMP 410" /LENGTH=108 /DNA_ID=CAMNT_0038677011 /DNA_START=71 /DNA_END=397 /DNA_ORIENTATION=-
MALSLLNHFMWEIPEARIPFMIADSIVIFALHMVERSLKKEKAMRELQEANELAKEGEDAKMEKKASKAAQRKAQKDAAKRDKHAQQHSNGGGGGFKNPIQQPSKKMS